jgi:subtilisin-like proprotein convertase family protein
VPLRHRTGETDRADLDGGAFRPSAYDGSSDTYTAPWPASIDTSLATFNNTNPNGIWRLWVRDDAGGDVGSIAGGFRVSITTAAAAIELPLGDTGGGVASPYPQNIVKSGIVGKVTDVNVSFTGLSHTFPDDLDVLLVGPQGQKVMLMSDACGSGDINNFLYTFDDEASQPQTDGGTCFPIGVQPVDYQPGENLPAPAPAGPYGTSLSVFDMVSPNGTWQLFINDDASADSGYLINPPTVNLTIDPPPQTSITKHPLKRTTRRKATFEFTSNEAPDVTYQCKLNLAAWRSCTSPKVYTDLKFRLHTFQVRAIDTLGTKDPTPAKWVWRVVR